MEQRTYSLDFFIMFFYEKTPAFLVYTLEFLIPLQNNPGFNNTRR